MRCTGRWAKTRRSINAVSIAPGNAHVGIKDMKMLAIKNIAMKDGVYWILMIKWARKFIDKRYDGNSRNVTLALLL